MTPFLNILFPPCVGSGVVRPVSCCKPFSELLPEFLPWRSSPPASRRAGVTAQKPQTPQQGPRWRWQHGMGQPDAQWVVEEHCLRGPELLPLHHTMVCAYYLPCELHLNPASHTLIHCILISHSYAIWKCFLLQWERGPSGGKIWPTENHTTERNFSQNRHPGKPHYVPHTMFLSNWFCVLITFLLSFQILIKEYNFDSRHKPAFTEEDILNIFPVVKHVNPKASDAFHFFQSGQAKVQQGELSFKFQTFEM